MGIKKLEEIAEIYSGVQISRYIDDGANQVPVIKNKFKHDEILDYSLENVSKDINEKYFSKKNDIIVSLSQPNTVSVLKENGYIIPMYFAIIRLKEGYDSNYIYQLLKSNEFHKKLHTLLEGGALKVIKVNDLKKIKINLPDIEKQKKYGDFLNLIDRKNNLLEKKKMINEDFKEYVLKTQKDGE